MKLTADDVLNAVYKHGARWQAIADELNAVLGSEINGDTSDGYHTFNELYHHRAVLFSVIVENYRDAAWKAKKHHDGTMYDGMFIVGIDTPWGQASYHYDIDPYWDMFDCEEREAAPEWDGHTPDDAIERIGKLATLGGNGYKQAAAYWKRMFKELLTERIGGKLTAEQVGEAIKRNFAKVSVIDDGNEEVEWREDWVCRVGIDYRAIADELNAVLGSGTCDAILDESYCKGIHGYCEGLKCSNCGEPLFSEFKSCPWCGMTIRKAVKQ